MRVFITGASRGLGEALAREYAGRGAVLGLVSRHEDRLAELGETLRVPYAAFGVDVRDDNGMAAAGREFCQRFGPPDIVIACAGVSCGNLTEHREDLAVFQALMDINATGMVKTFQPFLAEMRKSGSGILAGIASVAGFRGLPGASAYSASKAAAIAYLESLRVELRGSGLAVVTVCPGYIATDMTAVNPYPMPFLLTAEDAARRIARAIDRRASFAIVPWQMGLVGTLLRAMPNRLYDILFHKAPHKPRNLSI